MIQLLVMAKAPVPGRVKTRLCPPCTPDEAAALAEAALADTLATASQVPVVRRTAALEGSYPLPPGWSRVAQRGEGLGERLAYAFTDTALPGVPTLLIGMDTPQLTTTQLAGAAEALTRTGAVLGPALDGGWWALGLSNPHDAQVLPNVPMSTPSTGDRTSAALRARGVHPFLLPPLRDVDTGTDAREVAAACPADAHFPSAVARILGGASGHEAGPGRRR
ncbi:TIGR04282 family arsenosugar biosynthesis glycosyltransferase [Actinoplanes sp. CA-131856]